MTQRNDFVPGRLRAPGTHPQEAISEGDHRLPASTNADARTCLRSLRSSDPPLGLRICPKQNGRKRDEYGYNRNADHHSVNRHVSPLFEFETLSANGPEKVFDSDQCESRIGSFLASSSSQSFGTGRIPQRYPP